MQACSFDISKFKFKYGQTARSHFEKSSKLETNSSQAKVEQQFKDQANWNRHNRG